jgi:hypothetical protein
LKSQDFGGSWQNTLTQPNSVNFNDIHFSSIRNGWAVGPDYALWRYNPSPPNCVKELVSPENGGADVSNLPDIVWSSVSNGCIEGYYISIGTSLDSMDLLNRYFVGLDTSYTPGFELPFDTNIFVKVEPFNSLYFANGCKDFLFRTEVCKDTILTFIDTSLKKNQVFLGQLWEQDTFFQVALKAINNCDSIIYYNIVVDRSGTLKTNKDSQISLYPNPTTNTLQFQFADHLKLNQIEVFSLNGKLQFKLEEIQSREINLQNLPAGMYTIRFVFEGGVVSRKVCKN